MAKKNKKFVEVPEGKKLIFRPWITVNGVRIYAWQRGVRAFAMLVDA